MASRAISSGATPGLDTASAQCRADVVDSVRRLSAYPGDLEKVLERGRRREVVHVLSTVLPLVYIRIKVDIGNVTIEHRTAYFDHAVGKLRTNSYSMSISGTVRRRNK